MTNQPSQSVDEAAEQYANKFVATPRKQLESWQKDKADDFIAGHNHAMQSAQVKGLVDALENAKRDLRFCDHIVLYITEALKQFKGE